jgi:dihydrodipicolinate synthase/N-acetylneuraminate lyase
MEYLFKGVCPVINLPFDKDFNIDYKGMESVIDMAIADGCKNLCLFAFNSEPHKLTWQEKKNTIIRFLDVAKGRVSTLVGIIDNSILGGIELARLVEEHGGNGIILYPPSLSTPTGEALLNYFRTIAKSVNIEVMIQDNPRGTGVNMSLEFLISAYKAINNFNYIKVECPIPVRKMRKLIELTDNKIKCYSGNGGIFAIEAFEAGAWGIMPGVATVRQFIKIYDLYMQGKKEDARDVFENILPLVWYEDQSVEFYIACEKELLKHRGIIQESILRDPGEILYEVDKRELYTLYNRLN